MQSIKEQLDFQLEINKRLAGGEAQPQKQPEPKRGRKPAKKQVS